MDYGKDRENDLVEGRGGRGKKKPAEDIGEGGNQDGCGKKGEAPPVRFVQFLRGGVCHR